MDSRNKIRRIGVNINQAARSLSATGKGTPWIERALVMANRPLTRVVDDAAAAVSAERCYRPLGRS